MKTPSWLDGMGKRSHFLENFPQRSSCQSLKASSNENGKLEPLFQKYFDTGRPKSIFANSNGCNCGNMHTYSPCICRAKMCLLRRRCKYISKIVNKQLKNENKLAPPKHILTLPERGQKSIVLELLPFE